MKSQPNSGQTARFNPGDRVRAVTVDGETIIGPIVRVKPALPAPYEVEVDWAESEGLSDEAVSWYHSHYAGPFKESDLTRV